MRWSLHLFHKHALDFSGLPLPLWRGQMGLGVPGFCAGLEAMQAAAHTFIGIIYLFILY